MKIKEDIKRLFAILVLFILIINSSFLVVVSTAIDAIENLIDENKVNAIIEVNLEKYVNYKISDETKGTLLQANIKTGIEYEEGQEYTPIKATKTTVNLPQIDGKYPESLEVISKSTKATNGDDNGKDMYYRYDKENGKLEIVVDNKESENGDIYTQNESGARDEFVVISNYSSECYNDENVKRDLNITGTVEEILANEDGTKLVKDYTTNFEVTENISGIISTEVTTSDIYNGYINSNKENGTENATEYTENMKIDISYKEISEEITIETNNKFINTQNKEIETEEIVYKGAKVNKQNVIDILGEEGKLEILNKAGEIIGEINKDTETQEDGTVEINYEKEETEITIKTSKPEKLGTIEIENKKAIKETMTEIKNTKILIKNTIKCENKIQEKDEETQEIIKENTEEIYNYENTKEIEIKQAETKIDINIDKTEWTNNVQNDVTITATLITNGAQYNLFKNPVIEIKLPEEVEKVILGETSILYENNLNIKNAEVVDSNGSKIIRIEIEGTQNEYTLNSIVNGANIIIPATIILKKDIDSVDSAINVTYTNENGNVNDYNNEGNDSKSIGIKINSMNQQTGVMAANASIPSAQSDATSTDGLNVEMYAQVGSDVLEDGDTVYENEIITYIMKATNTSSSTINNIKFEGTVPDGTTYVTKDGSVVNPDRDESEDEIRNDLWIEDESKKQEEILISSLSAGETITKTYKVKVNELTEDVERKINSVVKAYVGNEEIDTKTINSVVKDAKLSVEIYAGLAQYLHTGKYCWNFKVDVTNNTKKDINNVWVESKLNEVMDYIYSTANDGEITLDIDTRNLKIEIGTIEAGETVEFGLVLAALNFNEGEYEYNIPVNVTAYGENTDTYRSDTEEVTAYYTSVSIVKESSTEGKRLKSFEEIEYKITVTNEGLENAWVKIIDNMPEGIKATKAEYEKYQYNEETGEYEKIVEEKDLTSGFSSDENDFELDTNILQGSSLDIKIYAYADAIDEIKEVENVAIVQGDRIKTKISNTIKNTILPYGYEETEDPDTPVDPTDPDTPIDPDNPNNPDEPDIKEEKYNIDGLVWIDENKNGKRDETESALSGITVKLFNSDTNAIVVDDDNNSLIVTTDTEGKYEFNNIKQGNYLVLFEYDTSTYEITTYQKNGVSEKLNSDAIKKEVSIDGNTKQVGITDILSITNKDLNNIDMGLIKNPIFDLKLDKYISKVTVSNSQGTTEKTYENEKLAKVEIPAKQLNSSTVEIEYKIVVTNEGEVAGYISEVLDYLPSELTFDSDKNTGWSKTSNGELKNTSLSNKSIAPGESKELTLILTKKMTQDTTGRIVNAAEIGEAINIKNLSDRDSTEGNKVETEDDYSTAEVIISVKTGVVAYIMYTIIILVVLVIMFILIKNKKINHLSMLCIIGLSVIVSIYQISNAEYHPGAFGGNETAHDSSAPHVWITENPDLGNHFKEGNWSSVNTGPYWCLDPGSHLSGSDNHSDYYYEVVGACGPVTSEAQFKNWVENDATIAGLLYNGTIQTYGNSVFSNIKIPSITFEAIDNSKTKIEKSGSSYSIIGPYTLKYSYQNCSDIKVLLDSCKINGKDITGAGAYICDANGNAINKVNSGGQIYIYVPQKDVANLQISVKLQSEEVKTGAVIQIRVYRLCDCPEGKHNFQSLVAFENNDEYDCAESTGFSETKLTGKLTITKKDADTGASLSGATFTIKGPIESTTQNTYTVTTGSDGKVTVENLLPGKYTVTEVGAPSGYNLNLQGNQTQTVEVKAGETSGSAFYNKQYGNILVTKKDQDTGQIQIGGIKLENIKFKLYVIKNGQKQYLNGNASSSNTTHYNYSDFNVSEQNKAGAKTFITDSNAQFAIQNLPVYEGTSVITYYIEEYELPANLTEYYDIKGSADALTIGNGITVDKTIVNKQVYVQISGYVWDDLADESKQTLKNDLYDAGKDGKDGETRVNEITVRLKHTNGTTLATTTTGTNVTGAYRFTKVKISELSNYYIEFEYNGLKYTNVLTEKDKYGNYDSTRTNTSKAKEKTEDRTSFNNSYASIIGGNVKESTTTGYSENENGQITNQLTYTDKLNDDKTIAYGSELVQNTEYTVASASGSVVAQNGSVGVTMKADTKTGGYTLKWTSGIVEISNINLGITAREQPDMAISTDLNAIDLTMNGYSHTYAYNQRIKATGIDIFSEIEKWNKTEKEQKQQEDNGYPRTYTRSIYKNYVYASGATGEGALEEDNKLQVYLIYKIVVKNESSSLYMSANEIVNYCDTTLDFVESWYEDSNGNKVDVTWTSEGEKNGYNEMRTTSLKDVKIEHGQSITIYLKAKKNNVISWATQNEINDMTYNVTEIASYSSYTKNGDSYLYYAGIDTDSAPDNIIPGRGQEYVKRYEDDTDAAPVVEITFDEPRTISGYVFEDVAKFENNTDERELHTGEERKGDGYYNANEDGYVENVKVELIKVLGDTTAYIYPNAVSESEFDAEKAEYVTANETTETKQGKGYYEFVGILPGEYYLKYTYGDGSVIYKKAGGTVDVTTQDYKSTIITSDEIKEAYGNEKFDVKQNPTWYQSDNIKGYSAAVDDYDTREDINGKLSTITYQVRTEYENKDEKYADCQTMTARTPDMNIAIENTDKETTNGITDENRTRLYDNINFGIVERPRKSIKTTKEIKYIRLILANGQVLVEGDPRTDSIRYVTYPDGGNLKIEVDNEIIEGATLEVTYAIRIENLSELDYDTEKYYKYGDRTGATPVVMKIDSVIDYMDEDLSTEYTYNSTSGWKMVKPEDLKAQGLISEDVYSAIKNKHNVLVNEDGLTLSPKDKAEIEIRASKLLSTSKEMLYKNYAEILTVSNSVGRFYGQKNEDSSNKWKLTIPGNFVPADSPIVPPEDDTDKVTITIIPPTGQDMNQYVVASVIGISCLVILTVGIVLIKKKVLD